MNVRRALISVWDKSGLAEFAGALARTDVEILATGGTAQALLGASIPVTRIEEITGFPEILDGRVKTLHPAIFAGILARGELQHLDQLAKHGLRPIELVAVNLYPFDDPGRDRTPSMQEAVELIDIGGAALLRAAAKNWERVTVISDPSQYGGVLDELKRGDGISTSTRHRLAREAFTRTAAYDAAIAAYFGQDGDPFPARLVLAYQKAFDTRYGENPHQRAAFYREVPPRAGALARARQLQGKELSFNNIADLDAAWGLVWEFEQPAAAVIKHATPCGAAIADTPVRAYLLARNCDPISAFGGVVALNRPVDGETARATLDIFTEAIVAPAFTPDALSALARKPNLRILECDRPQDLRGIDVQTVLGGLLVQERDIQDVDKNALRVVTPRAPSEKELADLRVAWKVAKWVKSNAIVLVRERATVGIGTGQPNRVSAVELAVKGAGERASGAALASDAFFPFRDGVDAAARAGVTAIIQPGGSVRDNEVSAAATEHGLAMVFTGVRHFRH